MNDYFDDEEGSEEYSKEESVADEFDADFEETSSDEEDEEDQDLEQAPKKKGSIFDTKKKAPVALKKFVEKDKGKKAKSGPTKTAFSKKPASSKTVRNKQKPVEFKNEVETDQEQPEEYFEAP